MTGRRTLVALVLGSLTLLVAVGSVAFLRAEYRHEQEIRKLKLELIDTTARLVCLGASRYARCVSREIESRVREL